MTKSEILVNLVEKYEYSKKEQAARKQYGEIIERLHTVYNVPLSEILALENANSYESFHLLNIIDKCDNIRIIF